MGCGIREGRCSNQVAGVGALKPGDETFTDASVDAAVRGRGLVRKAGLAIDAARCMFAAIDTIEFEWWSVSGNEKASASVAILRMPVIPPLIMVSA